MQKLVIFLALVLVLSLAACGGDSAPAGGGSSAAGDAAAGQKVFSGGTAPACSTCHSLEPGVTIVGPSLAKIGAEAGSRQSGQSASDYLHQSIVEPDAHVVEGFAAGLMPATYGGALSEQQIADLVAYMLTLK
jgi:cytochrome c2